MNTTVTESPREAAGFLRSGELVAFPTETVYGLGADLFSSSALEKVFAAKGRPADNPLIAHVWSLEQILRIASDIPPRAERLIERFFPGPLTIVLPKRADIPMLATAGLETIGVRMPRHPVAREFLYECETPVAAPSANRSGRPSPTDPASVLQDLGGRIACLLVGEKSEVGLESTVVDCTQEIPVVLRAGALTVEALRSALDDRVLIARDDDPLLGRSPGRRYRHYAPDALVTIVDAPEQAVPASSAGYIGLALPGDAVDFGLVRLVGSLEEYARELYGFFRECDARGIEVIYCEAVPASGLGLALMDRLVRAAAR